MIIDSLLQLMAERRASDLFVSAGAPIHIRIHGRTMPINQQLMEAAMIERMVGEILPPERMEQFARERELNLSVGRRDLGNFRINLLWQRGSIALVVRYLPSEIPPLDALGLPAVLGEMALEQHGLVLVVGASGAGKSTTLASMIDYRSSRLGGHILTVEDPIEYLFRHRRAVVNQREVGIDTLGWNEALRNAMRQAPDCILIGEIRDRETMQAALSYAQSGHLCLASLHATNAWHTLNRILNFFPLENRDMIQLDLAVSLRCVISQRLVQHSSGNGRLAAVEILRNAGHVAELIERGKLTEIREAMERSLASGSQTFEQDLFRLYRSGAVTLEEALAHADSPSNLYWLVNNAATGASMQKPMAGSGEPTGSSHGASFQELSMRVDDPPGRS